jgi:hypothetical protein
MQKKVALALYFFNSERTNSVISGVGPSSKVRKTSLLLKDKRQVYFEKNLIIKPGVFIK